MADVTSGAKVLSCTCLHTSNQQARQTVVFVPCLMLLRRSLVNNTCGAVHVHAIV